VIATGVARANTVTLDNNLGNTTGRLKIPVDEFGSYGTQMNPQTEDKFKPAGHNLFSPTWFAGVYVFFTTQDGHHSAVVLNADSTIDQFADGGDGIDGTHLGLARVVTSAITLAGNQAQSAFALDSSPADNIHLAFTLTQTLNYDPGTNTSELVQSYTIVNNGQTLTTFKVDAFWDPQLIWADPATDDIAGVGVGLCYVYTRDHDGADQAVALADGGSTTPFTSYYAGKDSVTPPNGAPAFDSLMPQLFLNQGVPATWKNYLANHDYSMAGESGEQPVGDSTMDLEWELPQFATGASETIVIRRIYGTSTVQCPAGPSCGINGVDPGEDCDSGGVDTVDCNGETCRFSACGDGHLNTAAGEECESQGVDSETCIGATCKTSACGDLHVNSAAGETCDEGGVDTATCNANCTVVSCGDGYVNTVAGEQCEDGELCDLLSCTYDFELGGGCVGCNTKQPEGAWILGLVACSFVLRRRRYNSRRSS